MATPTAPPAVPTAGAARALTRESQQGDLFGVARPAVCATPPAREFYFSGTGQVRDLDILVREHARGMVSATRLACSPKLRRSLDHYDTPLALDSGAFTNQSADPSKAMTLARYRSILRDFEARFDFVVNLDTMGDVKGSDEAFQTLRAAGHGVLYVHQAKDPRPLAESAREALQAGDSLIAIGGLVKHLGELRARPSRDGHKMGTDRPPLMIPSEEWEDAGSPPPADTIWTGEAECVNWLAGVGRQARALSRELGREIRLHLLGVGSLPVLRCVSPERWFASADATTWIDAARHGRHLAGDPWRLGQQVPRKDQGPTWDHTPHTFSEHAAISVRATLGSCHNRTRILTPADVEDDDGGWDAGDDMEYWERVNLARRFGEEDETEFYWHLCDVLDMDPDDDADG